MATTISGAAKFRLGDLAVRSKAVLRVEAPEAASVGALNGRVVLRPDEHPLPAEGRAEIGTIGIVAF